LNKCLNNGYINLLKPSGISSFRALSIVKKKLGLNKVGFLGTLDPNADGVLVLLIGSATKAANELHENCVKQTHTLLPTHICANNSYNLA